MITLYHGSNVRIESIDLGKCKPYKDFGKGFYLTILRNRLCRWLFAGQGLPELVSRRCLPIGLMNGFLMTHL